MRLALFLIVTARLATQPLLAQESSGPQVSFNIFGDAGAAAADPRPAGGASSTFAFGTLDFFALVQLTDRARVLSETLIEGGGNDDVGLDQERLWFSYSFGDPFTVLLGLNHTLVSRWNRQYHHGRWLETSIERPFLARFEDDAGILPMHYQGLEVGGHAEFGLGRVEYAAIVSNGRGPVPDDRQRIADGNEPKSYEANVGFSPSAWEGLTVGATARVEQIPPDPLDPARAAPLDETIASLFAEWSGGGWSLIAEFASVDDEDQTSGADFTHNTGYVQVAWSLGDWTPYLRYDTRNMDLGDPFYAPVGADLDQWEQTIGLRCELGENAAVKVELRLGKAEDAAGAEDERELDLDQGEAREREPSLDQTHQDLPAEEGIEAALGTEGIPKGRTRRKTAAAGGVAGSAGQRRTAH
jgi:hypothetical protein